uniref:Platelet-activating factor acetylhydrolase IB subunit alpha1 n=1 Tax=Nothobranchius furzeri TaxID=105023 RepID=A0A8C6KS65_NOTFU
MKILKYPVGLLFSCKWTLMSDLDVQILCVNLCSLFYLQIWRQLFSPLHCLNFGVGGDATQHVLWRLSNGELDNISPKVVVLWVGTNNHGHTAEQICGGIMAIVQVIHNKLPHAQTLVLVTRTQEFHSHVLYQCTRTCDVTIKGI